MEWIQLEVPGRDLAFTGSMQLLAGVRLCTGVPITNHPHFEDLQLRQRTKEVSGLKSRLRCLFTLAGISSYTSQTLLVGGK